MESNQGIVHIKITRCRETAHLPFYARIGDAGMDIVAVQDVLLKPGQTGMIQTGLKVAIPDGYEIQVRPRSGLSFNTPLRVSNSPGTIDSGYRDEICILISNSSCGCMLDRSDMEIPTYNISTKGNLPGNYQIREGDRIAQIVVGRIPRIIWDETDSVSETGNDRGGGFGSTGTEIT